MTTVTTVTTAKILLVEDNPADIELTKEALNVSKISLHIDVATDGEQAWAKLNNEDNPDLILLDLNLPKLDGRELLKKIKKNELLKHIPIIILTSSEAEEDIEAAYIEYANWYIQKPIDFGQFVLLIQSLDDFWFTVIKLPKGK